MIVSVIAMMVGKVVSLDDVGAMTVGLTDGK